MKCFVQGNFMENTYLITNGNEGILIDPGEDLEDIINDINKYDIKAILLTHGHIDHIDGIKLFKNTPIYLYKDEYEVFKSAKYSLYEMCNKEYPFELDKLDIRLLNDNEIIYLIGYSIKVIHTPGHTKGSCCYLINDKTLFSGDTLFQVGIGRTDYYTGNMNEMINSLNFLKALKEDIKVNPGHGIETTIGFENGLF